MSLSMSVCKPVVLFEVILLSNIEEINCHSFLRLSLISITDDII